MAAEIFFYANYWGIYGENREAPGTGVVWSLAVEEHFYLLFPLLYIYMQKWRMSRLGQARLLWTICAVILVWRCVLVLLMHANSARIYLATDTAWTQSSSGVLSQSGTIRCWMLRGIRRISGSISSSPGR